MKKLSVVILGISLALTLAGKAYAVFPSTMTIQGISFPTSTISGIAYVLRDGATVYSTSVSTQTDSRGIFNFQLTGLSSSTFATDGSYSIQFYIAGTTTTVPIHVVPFAFRAATADNPAYGAAYLASTQTFTGQNTFFSSASFMATGATQFSMEASSGIKVGGPILLADLAPGADNGYLAYKQAGNTLYISTLPVTLGNCASWTPSFGGFSTTPTGYTARYCRFGKIIWAQYLHGTSGTSNSTAFTITLPVAAVRGNEFAPTAWIDNGLGATTAFGLVATRAGSTTADLYRDVGGTPWTASGAKDAYFTLIYEAQ